MTACRSLLLPLILAAACAGHTGAAQVDARSDGPQEVGPQEVGPQEVGPHGDWPQWGGPNRSFAVAASAAMAKEWPESGPPILWTAPLGPGFSGIAVHDGLVVTAFRDEDDDVVRAFDAASGDVRWSVRDSAPALPDTVLRYGPGPHSTPLMTADAVLFAGSTGNLLAIERSGELRWRVGLWSERGGTFLERGYAASPIEALGSVIVPVGGSQGAVAAFRLEDGSVAWAKHDVAAAYASPVLLDVGGDTHLVQLMRDALLGLDPATGTCLWRRPVNSKLYAICATPVTHSEGRVMTVTADDAELLQVEPSEDGFEVERLWRSRRIGSQDQNVLRMGERIVGSCESTTLAAIDTTNGRTEFRTRTCADASLIAVGELLLALSESGTLTLLRPGEDGVETLASTSLLGTRCWGAMALAGTTLFARDGERIVAVDLRRTL